jgi:hypothetical protein
MLARPLIAGRSVARDIHHLKETLPRGGSVESTVNAAYRPQAVDSVNAATLAGTLAAEGQAEIRLRQGQAEI